MAADTKSLAARTPPTAGEDGRGGSADRTRVNHMILNVKVIPRASRNLVKEEPDALKVYLTKPAEGGLANKQLIEVLAEHLKVKKYQLKIIKGDTSHHKLIEVRNA